MGENLIGKFSLIVVWVKSQHLLEVLERLIHYIISIEAKASYVNCIAVGRVFSENLVGCSAGFFVALQQCQTLGLQYAVLGASVRNLETSVHTVSGLRGFGIG